MTYAFLYINLIPYMLIRTVFYCRYKLDRVRASWCELEGAKEKNIGAGPHPGAYIGTSKRLDHGPDTYIPLQLTDFGQKDQNSKS
jgi:hypothetical protein